MPENIIKISTGLENGGSNHQILYPPKFVFVCKDKKKVTPKPNINTEGSETSTYE